jgi:hypothetical protein
LAKRYGGQFSPEATDKSHTAERRDTYATAKVDPVGARANLMFIPAIPWSSCR